MNQKRFLSFFFLCLLIIPLSLKSQEETPSMKAWAGLLDKPELAQFFSDVFDDMGIIVDGTDDKFTVHHKGDHFTLTNGIEEDNVDYVVTLQQENIANMAAHGADASISEDEAYRILAVLFTPLTAASMQHPMMQKPLVRKLSDIENLIHVYLISPDKKEITSHTLIFVNKEWIVAEGIHGTALRTYKLTAEQALEYQKHSFRAMKTNTAKSWKEFKKWYKDWRDGVSTTP